MKSVPIGKVAKFVNGRAFKPSEWETEGLPIIRIQNLTGSSQVVNYFSGEYDQKHLIKKGDILISWSASLGVYRWEGKDSLLNQHIFKVVTKDHLVDKDYFYFSASSVIDDMLSQVHGTTMRHITKEPFESTEIPLPPLDEQKRIAAILSKADRLRRLRRYARELSDGYLGSVFLEMFGDPVSNPMGWDITSLGEICSLIRDGVHETPPYVPSGVPFITVKNIVTGRLDFQNTNFVSEEVHSELTSRVKPERGDILVSKDGTIGVPCVVDTDREFSIFVSVALLKPRRRIVDPIFLVQQIRSDAVQRQIRQGTKGIAIRHLHLEDFKRLIILLPPLKHQREFVRIIRKFERLRAQQQEAERQAEHLFQSLLHRAFRGEL
jgi:type I restriction enzyme S subunit